MEEVEPRRCQRARIAPAVPRQLVVTGYARGVVERAHEASVQIVDARRDGPRIDDLEHVEGNLQRVVYAVAVGGEEPCAQVQPREEVAVDGQGHCVAVAVQFGRGVARIDLLAQGLRSAFALQEGAEAGVVVEDGGGEVEADPRGVGNAGGQVQAQTGVSSFDLRECDLRATYPMRTSFSFLF